MTLRFQERLVAFLSILFLSLLRFSIPIWFSIYDFRGMVSHVHLDNWFQITIARTKREHAAIFRKRYLALRPIRRYTRRWYRIYYVKINTSPSLSQDDLCERRTDQPLRVFAVPIFDWIWQIYTAWRLGTIFSFGPNVQRSIFQMLQDR